MILKIMKLVQVQIPPLNKCYSITSISGGVRLFLVCFCFQSVFVLFCFLLFRFFLVDLFCFVLKNRFGSVLRRFVYFVFNQFVQFSKVCFVLFSKFVPFCSVLFSLVLFCFQLVFFCFVFNWFCFVLHLALFVFFVLFRFLLCQSRPKRVTLIQS